MNTFRKAFLVLVCCLQVCAASTPAAAAPALGDYDGDGLSDLAVALVDRPAGTTAWTARTFPPLFYSFNVPADALITGKFYQESNRIYPGVVYVQDASRPLLWIIKNPQGGEAVLNFGFPGSSIPNQADVDCDGITDLIEVANAAGGFTGYRAWHIASTRYPGQIFERIFGLTTDKIAVADVDGDGCAELIALRGTSYVWYAMKMLTTEFVTVTQWGLPGDLPLVPQDIDNDGKADFIIARRTGYIQQAYVRYAENPLRFDVIPLGLDTSIPLVGKFEAGGNSFAWFQRDSGLVGIRSRALPLTTNTPDTIISFGTAQDAIIRPDGTVIQPNEDGRFDGSVNNPPPPAQCDKPRFPDGIGGWLWKPQRDGGTGAGNATILVPRKSGALSTAVVFLARGGSQIGSARLRYHGGSGGRSVWDANQTNSALSGNAPFVVHVSFANNTCSEITIPNPFNRYD